MIEQIDARIARALGRIRQAFRGVLTGLDTAPAVGLFQADALAGERLVDNELMQHYGFTSAPPPGTMLVVLPIGGKTAHGIAVATEHGSYRLKGLKSGEVALYTDEGDSIVMKRGRLVEVTTQTLKINAGVKVELATPLVRVVGGELRVDEDITDREAHPDSDTMRGMRELYDIHTHNENNVGGGPTDVPNQQTDE